MVRSVWSGTLSFGLVAIPVKLVPATEPKDVRFHLVDAESGRRVRYRRVVEAERGTIDPSGAEDADVDVDMDEPDEREAPPIRKGAGGAGDRPVGTGSSPEAEPEVEVAFDSLARGVEVEPGVLVTLTPEEIRAVRPEPSRTIDIEDFVELAAIDPVHFEKSYVVAPDGETAEHPYALLLGALERAGRVGIGRFVLRTKPHLVAIRPRTGAIGLETLFFGDEVRDPRRIVPDLDRMRIGDRELTMAEQLIDMLATDWDPMRYADTYREELRSLIAGKAPRLRPEPEPLAVPGGGSDAERLMDALRESVERARRREPGATGGRGAAGTG
jgi:DNA end-binding protein Ku